MKEPTFAARRTLWWHKTRVRVDLWRARRHGDAKFMSSRVYRAMRWYPVVPDSLPFRGFRTVYETPSGRTWHAFLVVTPAALVTIPLVSPLSWATWVTVVTASYVLCALTRPWTAWKVRRAMARIPDSAIPLSAQSRGEWHDSIRLVYAATGVPTHEPGREIDETFWLSPPSMWAGHALAGRVRQRFGADTRVTGMLSTTGAEDVLAYAHLHRYPWLDIATLCATIGGTSTTPGGPGWTSQFLLSPSLFALAWVDAVSTQVRRCGGDPVSDLALWLSTMTPPASAVSASEFADRLANVKGWAAVAGSHAPHCVQAGLTYDDAVAFFADPTLDQETVRDRLTLMRDLLR